MITITLQPNTPEQLDAALALLQKIRDDKARSDAQFASVFRSADTVVLSNDDPHPGEREPGADEAEDQAPAAEQPKPVRRTRKTPPVEQPVEETNTSPEPVQKPAENEQVDSPAAPTYTLEQVRARLADLSRAGGKKDEVKALLEKYGAVRLTDIKPEDYASLMAEAEAL